jgi:hypothetical protein
MVALHYIRARSLSFARSLFLSLSVPSLLPPSLLCLSSLSLSLSPPSLSLALSLSLSRAINPKL